MTARADALSRVLSARLAHDRAEHALARLSEPAAFLALAATFHPLPDVRAVLERHAERCAAAHAAALGDLGRLLSRPLPQPLVSEPAV